MREWEDDHWRRTSGWHGYDLIHSPRSAVYIPCYFYSPFEPLGLPRKGHAVPRKRLQGPVVFGLHAESHRGLCHGGAMTSAFDDLLGHLAFLAAATGPWDGATVQVNCKLMKPVRVGQTLLLEGLVTKQERRKVYVEARLLDEHNEVYATMEGLSIVGAKIQAQETGRTRIPTWYSYIGANMCYIGGIRL